MMHASTTRLRARAPRAELRSAVDRVRSGASRWPTRWGMRAGRRPRPAAAGCWPPGNGGSAAQAQHLTAELVGRYRARPAAVLGDLPDRRDLDASRRSRNDYPPERAVRASGRGPRPPRRRPGPALDERTQPERRRGRAPGRRAGSARLGVHRPVPEPAGERRGPGAAVDAPDTATVQELHLVGPARALRGVRPRDRRRRARVRAPLGRGSHADRGLVVNGPLVIVGDVLLDVDTTAVATRLAPDAPVPVLEDAVERGAARRRRTRGRHGRRRRGRRRPGHGDRGRRGRRASGWAPGRVSAAHAGSASRSGPYAGQAPHQGG